MKKIFLTILVCLGLALPAYGGMIVELPLKTDLVDKKGSLGTGAFARSSAATYIHDGILYTADGDDTPFSNASVEDETGATEMRGSFVDGQAWFHDAGGLIAAYADTGNLLIVDDGTGKEAHGFIGEVGTGEVATALTNDVTAITKADPGVVSSVAHGLGVGDLVYFDSLTEMTELNTEYKVVTAVGSVDAFSINDTSAYGAAETTGGACAHEVTEPAATAVHIYKEHGLLNEGWNAIDTGIDYNAGAAWDFDVYVNLMTSTGSTAEARFEDGWLLVEPEGTNLLRYSENIGQWSQIAVGLDTGEADPRGGTDATGLVSTAVETTHWVYTGAVMQDDANATASIFAKAGAQSWGRLDLRIKSGAYVYSYFQLSGAGATGTNDTTKESITRLGTTDWYRISITHNIGTGAVAPPLVVFYSAEDDGDRDFTGDGSTIDTYIYGAQVEQTLFMTSYIPTNGIPTTRTTEAGDAADNGYSWTITQLLKNILDDAEPVASPTDSQGTLTFDVKWGCDETDIGATSGLITTWNAIGSLSYFTSSSYYMDDGSASSAISNPAFSAGDTINYVARWGDVDGEANDLSAGLSDDAGATWSFDPTPGVYDGAFVLGTDLRLSYSNLYPIHIRNIRFYDVAYTQAQIAAGLERNMLLWMIPFEFP